MAVDGIQYKTERNQKVAAAMKDCGKSLFVRNDVQYSTSNIASKNDEAVLNYILGKKGNSGYAVAKEIWSRYQQAISEAGLSPKQYTITKKESDFSWLDIRK
jgi:hypothetical protein